jgi:Flp pilus assembly secretin CpaC
MESAMPHKNPPMIVCGFALLTILSATAGVIAQPQPGQPGRPSGSDTVKSRGNAPAPSGESAQAIALTVWALTIKESGGPEANELEGALRDKANHLPAAVGTQKDVRDMVAKLKVAGLLHKSREIRLLALAGETATALMSADLPVIQAMNFAPTSGTINTIMYRSVGTIVEAKPVVDSDGLVQVGLTYECSFLDAGGGVVIAELPEKEPVRAPAIVRQTTTTLVRLESGKAVLVSSDATQDTSNDKSTAQVDLLILAAEIVAN